MGRFLVSIIIPVTRKKLVLKTLKSLKKQNYSLGKVEVILVGSDLPSLVSFSPLKLKKLVTKKRFLPGKMRNLGASKARGEILMFIDDDCLATPDWIKNNLLTLKDSRVGAVSGKILGISNKFFARCYDFSDFSLCQTDKRQERVLSSSTFALKKDLFWKVGGFNEKLRVKEDNDLCLKLQKKGFKTVYDPRIVIFHNHQKDTLVKLLKHLYFGGRNSGLKLFENYFMVSRKYRFFLYFRFPFLYFLFLPLFALFDTLVTLRVNIFENKRVILYSFFVFLAKLSYHLGVAISLLNPKNA